MADEKKVISKVVNIADAKQEKAYHCIITPAGMFVGESVQVGDDVELVKVCKIETVLTNQGMAMIGMLIGDAMDFPEDLMSYELDKKSPLLMKYLETISDIQIQSPIIQKP